MKSVGGVVTQYGCLIFFLAICNYCKVWVVCQVSFEGRLCIFLPLGNCSYIHTRAHGEVGAGMLGMGTYTRALITHHTRITHLHTSLASVVCIIITSSPKLFVCIFSTSRLVSEGEKERKANVRKLGANLLLQLLQDGRPRSNKTINKGNRMKTAPSLQKLQACNSFNANTLCKVQKLLLTCNMLSANLQSP